MTRRVAGLLVFACTLVVVTVGVAGQDRREPTERRRVDLNAAQRELAGAVIAQLQTTDDRRRTRTEVGDLVVALAAQGRGGRGVAVNATATADPLTGPVVSGAPYSADATTTVTQILGDGTRIGHNVTARFARDGAGRVRREQTIIGLAPEPQSTVTVDPDPGDGTAYVLDVNARTARRVASGNALVVSGQLFSLLTLDSNGGPATLRLRLNGETVAVTTGGRGLQAPGLAAGTPSWVSAPPQLPAGVRPVEESLGTRTIEGIKATGRKSTTTIPTGLIGNDRPIVITDERWESPELKVIVLSRFHDPRTGDVEYQLTNINRSEPPPDLFVVPSGYEILGGERGGGGGGRGARTGGPGGRQ